MSNYGPEKQAIFSPAKADCELTVINDKLWCTKCLCWHKVSVCCPGEIAGHVLKEMKCDHSSYMTFYCETCDSGKVVVDEIGL